MNTNLKKEGMAIAAQTCIQCGGEGILHSSTVHSGGDKCPMCDGSGKMGHIVIDEKQQIENQPKEFSKAELIQFGYFARKNPNVLMRNTFNLWDKERKN